MKNLYIFTHNYLDPVSGNLQIGGVETYVNDLCRLARKKKYQVTIYQLNSNIDTEYNYDSTNVIIRSIKKRKIQKYFNDIYDRNSTISSLFIVATDQIPIRTKRANVITIQHGIAFDIPGYCIGGFWGKTKLLQHINKILRCIKNIDRGYSTPNTVCVDYNYYNWFRTIGTIYPNKKIKIIPNYSSSYISEQELTEKLEKKNKRTILFARRFYDYRGTIMFSNVVFRLLKKYPNIEITFAGNGPLEQEIRDRFIGYNNVTITRFKASESITFHKKFGIAVIPTIFSEGTSLSLLEAMSAGCFPLATHVGGMTNVILNNYNGMLCSPEEESLYCSLVNILEMGEDEFNTIVKNAYHSSRQAFSLKNWNNQWSIFLEEVEKSWMIMNQKTLPK